MNHTGQKLGINHLTFVTCALIE